MLFTQLEPVQAKYSEIIFRTYQDRLIFRILASQPYHSVWIYLQAFFAFSL